jgi:hypothetical protein
MSALRDAVSEPLEMSFAHVRSEPFEFAVADEVPPPGEHTVTAPDGGEVHNYHSWGVEQAIPMRGNPGHYIIRYVFRGGGDTEFVFAHCLDSVLEPIHELMVGRDYGDQVIPLVASRWPRTYELLLRGCGAPGWPALMRLTTSTTQWAVALPYVASSTEEFQFPQEDSDRLLKSTMHSLGELLKIDELLPALVPILGGDDYGTRLTKKFNERLGNLRDIVGLFS